MAVNNYNLRVGFKSSWVFSPNAILIFPLSIKVNLFTTSLQALKIFDLYCISLGIEHAAEHSVGTFQNQYWLTGRVMPRLCHRS